MSKSVERFIFTCNNGAQNSKFLSMYKKNNFGKRKEHQFAPQKNIKMCDPKMKNKDKKVTFNEKIRKYSYNTLNVNTINQAKELCAKDNIKGNKDLITQKIIRYFEDPKESRALAEIRRISEKAKNNSSKNVLHICENSNNIFKRRKFQFSTQTYNPKDKTSSLIKDINKYKKNKEKEEKNKKYKNIGRLCFDSEEEQDEIKRNKYSSNTVRITSVNKYEIKPNEIRRVSFRYDNITEDYKKRNNLTVEKINNKEKVIKNEYPTKFKDDYNFNNYKTEYFWDKNIHRLIEKRIYFDDKTISSKNKYSNNFTNISRIYKKINEDNERENNITKAKIYLNEDKNYMNDKDSIVEKLEDNKPFVYSRKYKYMPHANIKVNAKNNDNENNKEINNAESIKSKNKIYIKRSIKNIIDKTTKNINIEDAMNICDKKSYEEIFGDIRNVHHNNVDFYLDNDFQNINNNISDEFTDFKSDAFNASLNTVESLIGTLDKCDNELNNENKRFHPNNLGSNKIRRKRIYKKYNKRIMNIE